MVTRVGSERRVGAHVRPGAKAARSAARRRGAHERLNRSQRVGARWVAITGPWSWWRFFVMVVTISAPLVLSYPSAARWFDARSKAAVVAAYTDEVVQTPPQELSDMLAAAQDYNQHLPNTPLRDPFLVQDDGRPTSDGADHETYEQTLNLGGQGVIGRVVVPGIAVDLPIMHDTDTAALDSGVGHLYGSALPIGGEGTHSVLTAHTGVIGSTLFSNLNKVSVGDIFQIQVLDQVLTYQVRSIETVLPAQFESLVQEPGKDLVTLVTCTPVGINTHRLLVTGERIPTPVGEHGAEIATPHGPGFPWWPFPTPIVALAVVLLTRRRVPVAAASSGAPWIDITVRRPRRKSFAIWEQHRRRIVKDAAAAASDLYLGTTRQAAAAMKATPGARGVYTWTLKSADGSSIGASAWAFPTAEAADMHARLWSERADELIGSLTAAKRSHVHWALVSADGEPVMFQVSSPRDAEAALGLARSACADLARARMADLDGITAAAPASSRRSRPPSSAVVTQ